MIFIDCFSSNDVLRNNIINTTDRASDISQKKMQNFTGFSGANSRKNRPISQDIRGKKVKIRGTIGRFCGIFAAEKSKFAGKSADFAGFSREKVNFRRIFRGKFLEKSADFTGNFGGETSPRNNQ